MQKKICSFVPASEVFVALADKLSRASSKKDHDAITIGGLFSDCCSVSFGDANRTLVSIDKVEAVFNIIEEVPSEVSDAVFGQLREMQVEYVDLEN
jgi:hypothetical protein